MKRLYSALIISLFACQPLCAQLWVQPGIQLIADSTVVLTLEDMNLQADGIWIPGQSTLHVQGTSPTQLRSQTDTLFLYDLLVEKTNGEVQLDTTVQVLGEAYLQAGNLNLHGQDLDFSDQGELANEAETHRVYSSLPGGRIIRQTIYNGVTLADSGKLGMRFSAPLDNLGPTTLIRSHDIQALGISSSIARYYECIPTNPAGTLSGSVDMELSYWEADLNALNEANLEVFRGNVGGGNWVNEGFTLKDPVNNYVHISLSGLVGPARFTLGQGGILPVGLLDFEAWPAEGEVTCLWRTSSEQNSDFFELEKSQDGRIFQPIARLRAAGQSDTIRTYTQRDPDPFFGDNYYRIRQVDMNGSVQYSDIRVVTFTPSLSVSLYPNPARETAYLSFSLATQQQVSIHITDMRGRNLQSHRIRLPEGKNRIPLDVQGVAEGIYTLKILIGNNQIIKRLQVE